jgi:hypothetical protein
MSALHTRLCKKCGYDEEGLQRYVSATLPSLMLISNVPTTKSLFTGIANLSYKNNTSIMIELHEFLFFYIDLEL